VASAVCQLISSGSYYYFSGHFADPTLAEFGQRLLRYGPLSLQSMAFYIALTAALHSAMLAMTSWQSNGQRKST
jgi:hypothetical protein